MKNLTSIITTTIITLLLFSTVVYTSCSKERDECMYMVCYNGGTCSGGVCTCPTGYEGKNCETKSDPCKNVVCLNGGACGLGGQCFCPYGYAGQRCEIKKCDTATCLNGATCQDGNCKCAAGYEGLHCETVIRERFLGKWKNISPAATADTITISDCGGSNAGVVCIKMNFLTTPNLAFIGSVEASRVTVPGSFQISGGWEVSKLKLNFNGNHMTCSYDMLDLLTGARGGGGGTYIKL